MLLKCTVIAQSFHEDIYLSGVTAPLILNLGTKSYPPQVPAVLPPEKERRYPLDMRLFGPQIWSGRFGDDDFYLPEFEHPDVQPVAAAIFVQFLPKQKNKSFRKF